MQSRDLQLKQLLETDLDVLIIGGGINGASVATAISSSEYRVALVDKTDFSSQSSQNSSGLIWGGIKYLQSGKVFLVRQLSRQRNALMRAYPSQISETRFLLLFDKENWIKRRFVYFGTWFYWLLGGGRTDRPRLMKKEEIRQLEPALAKKNGFIGLSLYPYHLRDLSNCKIEDFCSMIKKLTNLIGTDNIGIGSDLCLNWPNEVVMWMRNGKWTKKKDYGESKDNSVEWPKQPNWYNKPSDINNVFQAMIKNGIKEHHFLS